MKQRQNVNLQEPQRNRNGTAEPQRNRIFHQFNIDQYCSTSNLPYLGLEKHHHVVLSPSYHRTIDMMRINTSPAKCVGRSFLSEVLHENDWFIQPRAA